MHDSSVISILKQPGMRLGVMYYKFTPDLIYKKKSYLLGFCQSIALSFEFHSLPLLDSPV